MLDFDRFAIALCSNRICLQMCVGVMLCVCACVCTWYVCARSFVLNSVNFNKERELHHPPNRLLGIKKQLVKVPPEFPLRPREIRPEQDATLLVAMLLKFTLKKKVSRHM